ncbi:hypothetical protein PsYK624_051030 [Phanerochaete sordida]|uniref:Uncharacterized protein n=1 Tax=Phanerochaete sordida TaxID=48140 RepID=A0A9P3G7U6_9APHY|nr:hypothetical protein PsYK624_051030 [Phanerochaete sordida]
MISTSSLTKRHSGLASNALAGIIIAALAFAPVLFLALLCHRVRRRARIRALRSSLHSSFDASPADDAALAHLPAAHVHAHSTYDPEEGPAYEWVEYEGGGAR